MVRRFTDRVRATLRRKPALVEMARPYVVRVDSPPELGGLRAVVTGGSGAIGRAVALRLASSGAEVHVLGRTPATLDAVVAEAREHGGAAHAARVDLQDDAAVADFFASLPAVDILVNCAGGSARGESAALWDQSPEVIDRVLAVNLRGAISSVRAVAPKMIAQRSGRIISVGSIIASAGKARFADYAAAKAGLAGYMRSAAIEFGPYGVTVNLVSPGIVPRGRVTDAELDRVKRTNVLGAIGHEEDVAEAVGFLASPRARFITGQELIVDGGRSLGLRGDW
ncbi:3-oxoacyl-[acyl-carrier protein] reductase [Microbacterium sp. cf046]|uniref:SDR family NAD(P)-dependent oxidoreductase n=1 Tax=Microbacterium sp. cf046 TaxID=1761803 RepID=UPI0008E8D626|nr:SDR family NAD(P)-dependent oxidoreductase [Microbacterium sp. cf046]SFR90409.1 3-oxoacyl-[acyl-carrier protein] reductase [Microbacterium sp. cf046]